MCVCCVPVCSMSYVVWSTAESLALVLLSCGRLSAAVADYGCLHRVSCCHSAVGASFWPHTLHRALFAYVSVCRYLVIL